MKAVLGFLVSYIFYASVLGFLAYSFCRYFELMTFASALIAGSIVASLALYGAYKVYYRLENI